MNISNETIDVLKNFAAINPNIVINPGQVLKTISEAKNIITFAISFGLAILLIIKFSVVLLLNLTAFVPY